MHFQFTTVTTTRDTAKTRNATTAATHGACFPVRPGTAEGHHNASAQPLTLALNDGDDVKQILNINYLLQSTLASALTVAVEFKQVKNKWIFQACVVDGLISAEVEILLDTLILKGFTC